MPSTPDLQHDDPTSRLDPAEVRRIDARKLADTDDAAVRDALRQAIEQTGYLYLDHVFAHGMRERLLGSMRQFFSLADDDPCKQAICVTGKPLKHGWMPMFGEPAYQPGTVAHVESFDCGRPARPGDDAARRNAWPALPEFRDTTRSAWQALTDTGLALLDACSAVLALPPAWLRARCDTQDLSTMRLLHYPGGPEAVAARDVGIAAHTDFECITLLFQTAAGLELRGRDGHWRDAPAADDQVVVLFGDMLERFTNGAVQATGHRVRRTRSPRYSVVLFFAVNDNVLVTPAPGFAAVDSPPRFAPVTQRQHSAGEIERSEQYRDQERSA